MAARTRPTVVSVRADLAGRRIARRSGGAPVGAVGTIVLIAPEGPGWGACARMPDGSLLDPCDRVPVSDGIELVFDRPLPPGTWIIAGGEPIMRVEEKVIAV